MKLLDGAELAGYIKERQARQVRNLRQEHDIIPRLAIVAAEPTKASELYMRKKKEYGADILIEVDVHIVDPSQLAVEIDTLNKAENIHGIIVQLPLPDETDTDGLLSEIAPQKDVDGLSGDTIFTPATALAIDWLCAGYNVELAHKTIAIVGASGRLVGGPLLTLWRKNGLMPLAIDEHTTEASAKIASADLIVTATGVPGLINNTVVKPRAVVIDAGAASENGKIVGDVADDVRSRDDITITPEKGGVGPLTVAALFDNVIKAARLAIPNEPR